MSIDRTDFDQIGEADLISLIDTGVREGMAVEYKGATYGNNPEDVREFLKDVSSFANSAGGHLIIGMREAEGVATQLAPLTGIDPDLEVRRFENRMRDGITPRMPGIRTKAVSISSGGFAIIIRILRSWNPPHQVSAKNTNRFYIRNSAGAHETSMDELRTLFNFATAVQDRTRAFRQERLNAIKSGKTPTVLAPHRGRFVLHIVPISAFSNQNQIDLRRAYEMARSLLAVSNSGVTPNYNFDGVVHVSVGSKGSDGYTQVFRNGCVESVNVRLIAGTDAAQPTFSALSFRNYVLNLIPQHIESLQQLEVATPLVIMITLEIPYGTILGLDGESTPSPIQQERLEIAEIVIHDYGTSTDYGRQLRPALDALWNAGGYPGFGYYHNGSWRPAD
jgi:hypothetical protein